LDNFIKTDKNQPLFSKSIDKHKSVKNFEKKNNPLIEDRFDDEESREFTITKDQIPEITDRSDLISDIYTKRMKIEPLIMNKPTFDSYITNNQVIPDSPSFNIEIKNLQEKLLSIPNNDKLQLSNSGHLESYVKRKINFDLQSLGQFNHQIQSAYSSLYKSGRKVESIISSRQIILTHTKTKKSFTFNSFNIINQNATNSYCTNILHAPSPNQIDEINSLKDSNVKTKKETKFYLMSIDRYKNENNELNEELNVIKFERDSAITNYSKASKKIQELYKEIDDLQLRVQKTSTRFGQLIDYLYRLDDPRHLVELENIIGTDDKRILDDIHVKAGTIKHQLAEVIDIVYLSKDKGLIDKVNQAIKNHK